MIWVLGRTPPPILVGPLPYRAGLHHVWRPIVTEPESTAPTAEEPAEATPAAETEAQAADDAADSDEAEPAAAE